MPDLTKTEAAPPAPALRDGIGGEAARLALLDGLFHGERRCVKAGDFCDGSGHTLELEAGATENGTALGRLERNGGFDTAGRALGAGFCAGQRKGGRGSSTFGCPPKAGALGLAELAPFRVVLELAVEKE